MEQLIPIKVVGRCAVPDDELFANMDRAIAGGYPAITEMSPERTGILAIVASGPSVLDQLETIREMKTAGTPIAAIRGAHDWLIENGIIPDYALTVDPLPDSWRCFSRKHPDVHYLIASQCPQTVFDHLKDHRITIWHPYVKEGQNRPPAATVIGGGTTSGLRAIVVFYVLGWRHMALFGFDSCLQKERLRIDPYNPYPKPQDQRTPIQLEPDGEVYWCTPSMALQAQYFEEHYDYLPGIRFYPYGEGLIPAIIRKREALTEELEYIRANRHEYVQNGRISFIHSGGPAMASYRYRAQIPARELGASLNDKSADVLIFTKPIPEELMDLARAKARGDTVIVDFCDDHFEWIHYREFLRLADAVTCPTKVMAEKIEKLGRKATVIPDPYEFPLEAPHCNGGRLLWFGNKLNRYSLERVLLDLDGYDLRVVSNYTGDIPWSYETMIEEFARTDIVILPATEPHKSENRAVEAIRQGCWVVAEPHPALYDLSYILMPESSCNGIWLGNIREGIEWTVQHLSETRYLLFSTQSRVTEKYAPKTVAAAWKNIIRLPTISEAGVLTGTVGLT